MAKDVLEVLDSLSIGLDDQDGDDLRNARDRIAELQASIPEMMALYRLKWGNLDPDANAVYSRVENALAACRGLA